MDQVHCVSEGLQQLPSPRYISSKSELENKNIGVTLQLSHSDAERTDKDTQIIQMGHTEEKDHKLNNSDSNSRLQSIDDLTDMGFSTPNYSLIPTVRNAVPQ